MESIKISFGDYPRYEELVLRKDKLEKEALYYRDEYIRVFGNYAIERFELTVACIGLKKKINYCQAALNRGDAPDIAKITEAVNREMASYNKELKDMVNDKKLIDGAGTVSQYDLLKIKKIYHAVAKILHPDINPMTGEDEKLLELWHKVVTAYKCNKLKDLQDLQVIVNKTLKDKGLNTMNIVIDNIDQKISELEDKIKTIITTDPYNYRFLLDDEEAVEDKRKEFEDSIKELSIYKEELENILHELTGE